jgi:hypothetical protein
MTPAVYQIIKIFIYPLLETEHGYKVIQIPQLFQADGPGQRSLYMIPCSHGTAYVFKFSQLMNGLTSAVMQAESSAYKEALGGLRKELPTLSDREKFLSTMANFFGEKLPKDDHHYEQHL